MIDNVEKIKGTILKTDAPKTESFEELLGIAANRKDGEKQSESSTHAAGPNLA